MVRIIFGPLFSPKANHDEAMAKAVAAAQRVADEYGAEVELKSRFADGSIEFTLIATPEENSSIN